MSFARSFIILAFLLSSPLFAENADYRDINSLIEKQQFQQAQNLVVDLIRQQPSDQRLHFYLGSIHLLNQNFELAKEEFDMITDQFEDLPALYNNLALIEFHNGDTAKAIRSLEKAITKEPSFNTLYDNLTKLFAYKANQAYVAAIEITTSNTKKPLLEPVVHVKSGIASLPEKIPTQPTQQSKPIISNQHADKDIISTLHRWAEAWSNKDIDKYASQYSQNFVTPGGVSWNDWKAFRKSRIRAPKFIRVSFKNPKIILSSDASMASVNILQTYQSDRFKDTTIKHFVMQKEDNQWRIVGEYVGN